MSHPLAIIAPYIGARSETFIRRHMQDLLPGGTAVVAGTVDGSYAGHWSVDGPVLDLHSLEYINLKRQVLRAIGQKLRRRRVDHAANAVKRFLLAHNVQVLIGEYLDLSLPWLKVAQELGIRFYGHAHGYDISERLRDPKWSSQYLRYNEADGVITMSQVSKTRLVDMGLNAANVHVIPYGVDVPVDPVRRVEQKLVRCLAVGRMVAKKAPILTLDAFRRAVEVCPNLHMDYVGTGELFSAAQQFISAFNLKDKVTLHGGQPHEVVHNFMRRADIFLQHSMVDSETGDEEGLPVGILEAMAQSLPIVSTRHAGIPEAVLDGSTGYLVEEGDSIGMAERLVSLALKPDLRRQMGQAGWCRAKEHFAWEKERRELLKLLGLQSQASDKTVELPVVASLASRLL
jgi:glycosyltransferase involved in cell wall biosynthesis